MGLNLNVGYVDWFQQHMIRQERDTGCSNAAVVTLPTAPRTRLRCVTALYLRRASNDPGPDGRACCRAWRRLVEPNPQDKADKAVALGPKDPNVWMLDALDLPLDAALEDVGDAAKTSAAREGVRSACTPPDTAIAAIDTARRSAALRAPAREIRHERPK